MLTIYLDRLHDGNELLIEEKVGYELLDIQDDTEIQPHKEILFSGKAYLASDFLLLEGHIETSIIMRCSMCNEPFAIPIVVSNWSYEEPIENIRSAVFSYADVIRESILIEVPYTALCGGTKCHHADEIKKYSTSKALHDDSTSQTRRKDNVALSLDEYQKECQENGYQPFKDLFK